MNKILYPLLALSLLAACKDYQQQQPVEDTMHLKGQIRGLKKGMVYLERLRDSLITLDSVELFGSGRFEFELVMDGPELLYLHLEKKDGSEYNDRFPFFAEPGELTFSTIWNEFEREGILRGSRSDSLYRDFRSMISRFNVRELELTKALMDSDSTARDSLVSAQRNNRVGRVRYTLNFAFGHTESAVSPYALLSEGGEANVVYLDSLWGMLGPEARGSVYGQELGKALQEYRERNRP